MKVATFLILFAHGAFCTLGSSRRDVVAQVKTSSGIVNGHAAENATTVSEYLGIPFAQPPVGSLRFAPPVRLQADPSTVVNGTSFGFSCFTGEAVQPVNYSSQAANLTDAGLAALQLDAQQGGVFSEDCLTLNVWVPSGGDVNKTVMLWVYGGSFTAGSSSIPTYNGQYIADQEDVIVVSINYRVGIFGFPGNPFLQNLNLGILDQRLAFEWVRDNIQGFGGDATRITAFGQSAGSESLDIHSYAYPTDPIVSAMILESGTVQLIAPLSNNSAAWFKVTSTVGCGDASSDNATVMACMQKQDALKLVPASMFFIPAVDNITVFSDYASRSAAGNFSKIPLLIGINDNESSYFAAQAAGEGKKPPSSTEIAAGNLLSFDCPASARANLSLIAGLPTWRYRYFGEFPNTELTTFPDSGAWHGSEMAVIFDTLPSGPGIPASTSEEVLIGNYIRGAWAAFAKDPTNGLTSYGGGWPSYNPEAATLIRLAYNNLTGTNAVLPAMYDALCPSILPVNGTAGGNTNATTTQSPSSSPTGGAVPTISKPGAASGLFIKAWNSAAVAFLLVFVVGIINSFI